MATSTPIERLTETEAWRLLGGAAVGRLATVINRQPDIFPVNFVTDGTSVVFRTAEGSKLLQLTVNARVAFQADDWDDITGWSVVVKGTAEEVTDPADLDRVESLPLRPWVATVKTHFVRIAVDEIEGRRFVFGDEPEAEIDTSA
ncbi:MAG: pyridoxamine 5'-phosphate oxidase family protein [Micropruina sp.]|uniref:pyridoxamine 5'-phosphate oxidase family protein n=1 Tax=Micropruina sp. TaxID=2737536 RepID=UPI0039E6B4FE